MPVQYQPYTSMYVSQRSPEISKELRERYVNNFSMQDQVKQQLLELETAPFEGDQAAKEKLANEIRAKLDQFAERGDYENLTMNIAKTARQYQNKATPLKKNAELYNADKAEKEQLLQSGKITLSDYNGWLKKATMEFDPEAGDYKAYQGVQFDDSGNVVQGTTYQATPIAQFVDVQAEILKQLNTLDKVKEGGYTVQGYQTKDGVEYAVTKGDKIVEYISPDRVNQITQGVLNRADVQSYMTQEAEFSVLDADENTLNQELSKYAAQLKSSGRPEDITEAAKIENALNTGTTGQKRQAVQRLKYSDKINQYTQMGIAAKATKSVYGGSYGMEYSQRAIQAMKDKGEQVQNIPMFYGEAEQITSSLANEAGVVTPQSIQQNVQAAQNSVTTAIEVLQASNPEFQNMESTQLTQAINNLSYENLVDLAGRTESPGAALKELTQAKQALDAAQAIQKAAKNTERLAYRNAEYTPEDVSNTAIAEVATSLGIEANNISNQYLQFLQPGAPGFESVEDAYLGTAERIVQRLQTTNVAPGGDIQSATSDLLVKMTGMSEQEARDVTEQAVDNIIVQRSVANADPSLMIQPSPYNTSSEAMESTPTTQINPGLDGFVGDFMDTYVDIAKERSRVAADEIINLSSGVISFGESSHAIGASKKKSEEFISAIKDRTLGDFQDAQGLNGEVLYNQFAAEFGIDPEDVDEIKSMLDQYSVSKVAFTKGTTPNGQVKPGLVITAKGPESDQRKFKLNYDQIVASYPGFDSEIMGYHGTSADNVINNIYSQILASPGAALNYGVDYDYSDPVKGTFNFKFIPNIGANNSITGFDQIIVSGTKADGTTIPSTRLTSEAKFYEIYNDLVAR